VTKQTDLIAYLFDGQPHQLSGELRQWLEASGRFTAFVETNRDKIRKKIRVALEPETVLDLRSELEVAAYLLNDRRLVLAYEPYLSARRRGPDYAVTYKANLVFNLEVSRLRVQSAAVGDPAEGAGVDLRRAQERVLGVLSDKLSQMQPGAPNLLVIHTSDELARRIDLGVLMHSFKARAEAKDPTFYALLGYAGPAAFFKDYLRLTAIILMSTGAPLWINKQARPPLHPKALRLVQSMLAGRQPAA